MADDIYFSKKTEEAERRRAEQGYNRPISPYLEQVEDSAPTIRYSSSSENVKPPYATDYYGNQSGPTKNYGSASGYSGRAYNGDVSGPTKTYGSTASSSDNIEYDNKKKKRKKKGFFRRLLTFLLVVILLVVGALTAGIYAISGDYKSETLEDNAYTEESGLMSSARVYNILLLGIDNMDTTASTRSDAMILMSVDSLHNQIKLTSFMRDTYVTIPGYGDAKLNAACTYGGPQLVVDTIEYNFGIRIDAYAKIGYDMFITLVDGIGGVTIPDIDEVECAALAIEGVFLEPGQNIHLSGKEALHYCRIRKGQSDFNRTERQRETLSLIVKKAIKTNPVKLFKVAKQLIGTVQCSLSKTELIKLAVRVIPCCFGEITSGRVPQDGTWDNATRNSQAVLLVDMEANKDYLRSSIYN